MAAKKSRCYQVKKKGGEEIDKFENYEGHEHIITSGSSCNVRIVNNLSWV